MLGDAAAVYTKPLRIAVPPGVVTDTLPLAPLETMALMEVALFTMNEAASTPPNLTEVAPVRFVPVITTVAPLAALVGLKLLMVGGSAEI